MSRALVTGGSVLIGSHVPHILLREGPEAEVVARLEREPTGLAVQDFHLATNLSVIL